MRSRLIGILPFAMAVSLAAAIASALTQTTVDFWYPQLVKPEWAPPRALFAPVWSLLYATIAIAGWQFWRRSIPKDRAVPLSLWGTQLALNAAWPGVFFALKNPALGSAVIILLLAFIVATIVAFYRRVPSAAYWLLPDALWVAYATALTIAVWGLNR
jgi:translocator protein